MTGFPASVFLRLALGLAFTVGTGAMVWLIERPRGHGDLRPVAEGVTKTATGKSGVQLTIESSFRVEAWTIQVLGIDQPATRSDQVSWSGIVPLALDDEVLIQATAKPEPASQDIVLPHGLKIRLGSAPDRFIWGSGDMTATAGLAP